MYHAPATTEIAEVDSSSDVVAAEDVAENTAIIGLLGTSDAGTTSSVYGSGGLGKSGSGLGGGGTIGNFGKEYEKRKKWLNTHKSSRNQQLSQYQQPIEKEVPILSDQTTSERYTDHGVNRFHKDQDRCTIDIFNRC